MSRHKEENKNQPLTSMGTHIRQHSMVLYIDYVFQGIYTNHTCLEYYEKKLLKTQWF